MMAAEVSAQVYRQEAPSASPQGKTRRRARQYQRVAVRCGCWLEHQDATVFGNTVDVGRGGLFLRTALPMAPGVDVRVTLKLPGHEPVVAEGQVVHRISPQAGDRPGLGVRFDRVATGDEALHTFLGLTMNVDGESTGNEAGE
jgi:uncharacterized protein (TIGR02266 family)